MELLLLLLISASYILVGVVGNHAAPLPSEVYLKTKFPNTSMSTILHDLLHPAADQEGKPLTDVRSGSTIPHENVASNRQLQDNPGASLFFLQRDLYPGEKMNLQFAIIPKSEKNELISQSINTCEHPAIEGEVKYYATSLESLVEYGTSISKSKLGKNANALTTVIASDKGQSTRMRKQRYVVSSGVRQIVSGDLVVCHSLPHPHEVFCHGSTARKTQAYVVNLVGADGTKIKATAICHKDTSKWDPDHVAFQVLKVKPGTINPICQFLSGDNIVWAGKNKEN